MPILDPETLRPLPHADICDTFDEAMLWGGLAEIEAWHARVYDDLLGHLRSLPQLHPIRLASALPAGLDRSTLTALPPGERKPGPDLEHLLTRGLTRPASRFDSEWQAGLAFLLYPECARRYLGTGPRTDPMIARAIARWLADHHNGRSKEWTTSVREHGSVEGAIAHWTRRYLLPGSGSGESMLTRLQRVAARSDPLSNPVRQISDAEREAILRLETPELKEGTRPFARRYHFEVWVCSFLRQVRENLAYHLKHGVDLTEKWDALGRIEVQIASKWMQEWPYGSGGGGRTHPYITYVEILKQHGWLALARKHFNPFVDCPEADRGVVKGEARHYWFHAPPATTVRDLPIAPWELKSILGVLHAKGCADVRIYNDPVSLDEAYHALYLTGPDQVQVLHRRYGPDISKRIRRMAAAIRTLAAERADSGESLWQLEDAA